MNPWQCIKWISSTVTVSSAQNLPLFIFPDFFSFIRCSGEIVTQRGKFALKSLYFGRSQLGLSETACWSHELASGSAQKRFFLHRTRSVNFSRNPYCGQHGQEKRSQRAVTFPTDIWECKNCFFGSIINPTAGNPLYSLYCFVCVFQFYHLSTCHFAI